jgi:ketosteroid isomerase-like protein
MSDPSDLIDRYIAAWNETDAERRKALVASTFSEDATYLDPVMQGTGHAGIEAMIAGVQTRFPGHRFTRSGKMDLHHDHLRFCWDLSPTGGEPLVKGTDFAVLAADARMAAVTGFFDLLPAA